jgi:ABC-type multidrug transport system ATPase subunit/predicted component of type VI protein secretion system
VFSLSQDVVKLGRDPDKCQIVLNSPGVSRQHAQVRRSDGGYVLEDLGSANGTFVNNERLSAARVLKPGDTVRLGQAVTLTYQAPNLGATVFESPDVLPTAAAPLPGREPTVAAPPAPQRPAPPPQPRPAQPAPPPYQAPQQPRPAPQPAQPYQAPPRPAQPPPPYQQPPPAQPPRPAQPAYPPPGQAPGRGGPAEAGATMFMDSSALPSEPPRLVIETAGQGAMSYTLTDPVYTLGRSEDNSIQVPSRIVSRHHARLEQVNGGYRILALPDAGNPLLFEGRPLMEPRQLKHNDRLRIGGQDPGTMVTMTFVSPSMAFEAAPVQIAFGDRTEIQIGRDPTNEVRLDVPAVSRFHAVIQRVGQRYRVRDLRSVNGTFVNDVRIEGDTWLNPNDSIRIGPYRFVLGQDGLVQHDESGGMRVEVLGLNKWVRKDLNILQNLYLAIQPREFVVLVGLSGAGKSTLMDAIAGFRPATHGQVLVNGVNVYENFDAVRNDIGFVPQRDIIHMELSVFQGLDYAAQLRMPADTSRAERHKRVDEVLADLDLTERKNVQVSRLSGGQQKRVSIGVELLTKPGLFFLDEPTSGLDPGTETALMQLMRRLADQGRTIILITHATKNVMLADKVIFLVRGGYLAWFGPPNEALQYFDQFRTDRERRAEDIEFDDIYNILQTPQIGTPKEWAERFQQHPAFQKYIVQPLHQRAQQIQAAPAAQPAMPVSRVARRPRRPVSQLRQFLILSLRNLTILSRDRFSLLLMLLAAPAVAALDFLIAKSDAFSPDTGDVAQAITGLFLLSMTAILVGVMAQMREIVKEQDIYKRERLVNLKILPYVLSKVWVAALLALYQSAAYVLVRYLAVEMPGGWWEFLLLYITVALATFAGMMLGLFASALSPNNNSAPMIAILFIIPQILLGGAILPLPAFGPVGGVISSVVSSRWAFEAAMTITGVGRDVADDPCWDLPQVEIDALSLDFKNAECHCMGLNLFRDENKWGRRCYFPGLQKFYADEIGQPEPVEPVEPEGPGDPPQAPEFPPQPVRPESQDPVAQQEYANQLEQWQDDVQRIQDDFARQSEAYQAELDAFSVEQERYADELADYQDAVQDWQAGRTGAMASGENLIGRVKDDYGFTYDVNVLSRWFAQMFLTFLLFVGILILQKRKDVI